MKLAFLKEIHPNETRSPIVIETVKKYLDLGAEVLIESGIGDNIYLADQDFQAAGATVTSRDNLLKYADIVLRVNPSTEGELKKLKPNCLHISFFDPYNANSKSTIKLAVKNNISLFSMEMIPRITRAQKMDALSSQTNLAGYAAVLYAAEKLPRALPMLMTAAGTIYPALVFIIGVGVAGLQAIATAKRLGAKVEAFDTRPVVKEQVQSLGAKFVEIDLGETGETKGGHATALTKEQIAKQQQAMAKVCARANVVITTAQLFGRKAPLLVTKEMIAGMQPGSIVIDMAVNSGGNVAGVELNKNVLHNNVLIVGEGNLPGRVGYHASQMYAMNLYYLIEHLWPNISANANTDVDTNVDVEVNIDVADEIVSACLITHQGKTLKEKI